MEGHLAAFGQMSFFFKCHLLARITEKQCLAVLLSLKCLKTPFLSRLAIWQVAVEGLHDWAEGAILATSFHHRLFHQNFCST
jgi:hypothetical protein